MSDSAKFKTAYFEIGKRRFGVELSRVYIGGAPYLDRWILYVGGLNFRLHRFWRGDDDRAPHDHPWWFITFPFAAYTEKVFVPFVNFAGERVEFKRTVKPWRFHYRKPEFQHYVIGRADGSKKPFWTFVIASHWKRSWGFWPTAGKFVPWREWGSEGGTHSSTKPERPV